MASRRLPAFSPYARWQIGSGQPPAGLGARTGESLGTSVPARLQAVEEAGGRSLSGHERTDPRPDSVAAAVGASRGGAQPGGRSFSFGGRGGGNSHGTVPGQPPAWVTFLLWAPLETPHSPPLFHPTLASPGLRLHLQRNLIPSGAPKAPTWVNRTPLLGLFEAVRLLGQDPRGRPGRQKARVLQPAG